MKRSVVRRFWALLDAIVEVRTHLEAAFRRVDDTVLGTYRGSGTQAVLAFIRR